LGVSVPVGNWAEVGDSVRFYLTYAAKGENVYLRGFGSFIIKTRPEKVGRKINKT
jgi:nucleoid DNA-binding protein